MASVNKIIGFTELETNKSDFTWVIKDFKCILKKMFGENLKSPTFTAGSDDLGMFHLELKHDSCEINVMLVCIQSKVNCEITWKLSVIKDDIIVKINEGSLREYFTSDKYSCVLSFFNDVMDKYISTTDTAIFRCEVTTTMINSKKSLTYGSADMNSALVQNINLDWMCLNENLSDVKLRAACGKEIPAHKVVLANASPVFKAIFSLDMLENKNNSVDMVDISHKAAVEMLRYVYTGTVENDEISLTIDLLAAADKYQLEELKNKCEQLLSSKISSESAIDILKIANKYNMSRLKNKVADFIKLHINVSSDSNDVGNIIFGEECLFSK